MKDGTNEVEAVEEAQKQATGNTFGSEYKAEEVSDFARTKMEIQSRIMTERANELKPYIRTLLATLIYAGHGNGIYQDVSQCYDVADKFVAQFEKDVVGQ